MTPSALYKLFSILVTFGIDLQMKFSGSLRSDRDSAQSDPRGPDTKPCMFFTTTLQPLCYVVTFPAGDPTFSLASVLLATFGSSSPNSVSPAPAPFPFPTPSPDPAPTHFPASSPAPAHATALSPTHASASAPTPVPDNNVSSIRVPSSVPSSTENPSSVQTSSSPLVLSLRILPQFLFLLHLLLLLLLLLQLQFLTTM